MSKYWNRSNFPESDACKDGTTGSRHLPAIAFGIRHGEHGHLPFEHERQRLAFVLTGCEFVLVGVEVFQRSQIVQRYPVFRGFHRPRFRTLVEASLVPCPWIVGASETGDFAYEHEVFVVRVQDDLLHVSHDSNDAAFPEDVVVVLFAESEVFLHYGSRLEVYAASSGCVSDSNHQDFFFMCYASHVLILPYVDKPNITREC